MDNEFTHLPATSQGMKLKKPLDIWSVREKLCLASAVFKNGDQNWVSVSRTMQRDPNRPLDRFHQKNCHLQYCDMLKQLEQRKRKRGAEKSETEAQSLQIMRKMTIERSEQLKKEIMEMQQAFKILKCEVEAIKAGLWDDRIKDVWNDIQEELKTNEKKLELASEENEEDLKKADLLNAGVPPGDIDDTQDSIEDISLGSVIEEDSIAIKPEPAPTEVIQPSELTTKLPGASHLLSSLLKSEVKSATELHRLKIREEQSQNLLAQETQNSNMIKPAFTHDESQSKWSEQTVATSALKSQMTAPVSVDIKTGENAVLDQYFQPVQEEVVCETEISDLQDVLIESPAEEIVNVSIKEETIPLCTETEESEKGPQESVEKKDLTLNTSTMKTDTHIYIKEETNKDEGEAECKKILDNTVSETETELIETCVKDESPSPTSSICSRISETGSRRRSRGRPRSNKASLAAIKKHFLEEEKKEDAVVSDMDSEEDIRSDDPLAGQLPSVNPISVLSESFPNSPASLSMCSDTEEEKSLKQWKKSIMLVWRAAATHKFANVFLHPVTDDIAPGYRSIVHRPMDLSTIKKNIETGSIRTTVEFQRDMMLMFTNAIMYNSSNHNVYRMAKDMYDDVMLHIEQYVNTQMMIQTTDAKNLRQSRRPDASDKEDDGKKRRHSVDQSESGKIKKRKSRLDETLP